MRTPTDILTTLTSLAVSIFREWDKGSIKAERRPFLESDPVLQEVMNTASLVFDQHPGFSEAVDRILSEPDLTNLAPREGELDPMVMHAGGGVRLPSRALVAGLFSAAFQQIFCLRLPAEEGTFVRTVLEGFEELRRAARGERIRVYAITGIAGVRLPQGVQVSTPWGTLRPAPIINNQQTFFPFFQPETICILAESRLATVKLDRASEPRHEFDRSELTSEGSQVLFPLSCALASQKTNDPAVPLVTWSTLLLPFLGGFSYSKPFLPPRVKQEIDISSRIAELEEWARIVDGSHSPAVYIAARRLASAVVHRLDPNDSLIDAVMVWENLVGTSTEVTFRVTAALAKALEHDPTKRRTLRKFLAEIYNTRSRVVHGVSINPSQVKQAANDAVDIAVRVLRVFYRRGQEWLSMESKERADSLLLEEP